MEKDLEQILAVVTGAPGTGKEALFEYISKMPLLDMGIYTITMRKLEVEKLKKLGKKERNEFQRDWLKKALDLEKISPENPYHRNAKVLLWNCSLIDRLADYRAAGLDPEKDFKELVEAASPKRAGTKKRFKFVFIMQLPKGYTGDIGGYRQREKAYQEFGYCPIPIRNDLSPENQAKLLENQARYILVHFEPNQIA